MSIYKCAGGGGFLKRIYSSLSNSFIAFLAFGFTLATFINFYYYEIYKTNIDIFIFGLKDDNTQAILSIIFKDYPLLILFFCAVVFTAFCVWLNTKTCV
ncbi:hypothetical protein [Helicobacter ganmani]|uniref:hypothetical protein n=1 Tax=Helicobacter ganmani TaxID=60246 RepID=UPI003A880C84